MKLDRIDVCPYCKTNVSKKSCICGMLQVLNGECLVGEAVILVNSKKEMED